MLCWYTTSYYVVCHHVAIQYVQCHFLWYVIICHVIICHVIIGYVIIGHVIICHVIFNMLLFGMLLLVLSSLSSHHHVAFLCIDNYLSTRQHVTCYFALCHSLPNHHVIMWFTVYNTWIIRHLILCDASSDSVLHGHALHVGSFLVRAVAYLEKPLRQVCGMKQIIWPRNLQLVTIFAWWHGMPRCRQSSHGMPWHVGTRHAARNYIAFRDNGQCIMPSNAVINSKWLSSNASLNMSTIVSPLHALFSLAPMPPVLMTMPCMPGQACHMQYSHAQCDCGHGKLEIRE